MNVLDRREVGRQCRKVIRARSERWLTWPGGPSDFEEERIMRTSVFLKSLVLTCAVVVSGVAAATAGATPVAIGTWEPFFFGSTGSTAFGSPFTFTSSGAAVVTVTDAYCRGDRFTVSDGASTLGTTTPVTLDFACNQVVSDPDVALADPGYSSGRFVVGAGAHSVGIVAWPFNGGGTAFLRFDVFSAGMCKNAGWTTFQPAFKNQGDCVSFVATGGRNEPAG